MSVSTLRVVGFIIAAIGVVVMLVTYLAASFDSYWMLVGAAGTVAGALLACFADMSDPSLDR